jgi:hypothetical protein
MATPPEAVHAVRRGVLQLYKSILRNAAVFPSIRRCD